MFKTYMYTDIIIMKDKKKVTWGSDYEGNQGIIEIAKLKIIQNSGCIPSTTQSICLAHSGRRALNTGRDSQSLVISQIA